MSHQDWTTVTLKKDKKSNAVPTSAGALAQAKASGSITTERRVGVDNKAGGSTNLRKIDDATDVFQHQTVNRTLSQSIAQARQAKKMTQAQLAQAINESPKIIQEYEQGKAIPNPQVINKLDRALGIHLPRK
jgi:putative transcription factor